MIQQQVRTKNYFAVLIYLLREKQIFIEEIRQKVKIEGKIIALFISGSLFLAIYGAILGASHSWAQAISSAVKLPALYLITLIVCFPTLYFFSILFGSSRSAGQYFVLLIAAVSVNSVLLFSLAPVSLFFLVTIKNYQFFKLLNVAIFSGTGLLSINFLYKGMVLLSQEDSPGQANRQNFLLLWLVLYGFVGSQLSWTLSPFFGDPGYPFMLFNQAGGNFYLDIVKAIGELQGVH